MTPVDNRTVSGPGGTTYNYDHEGNVTNSYDGQYHWTYTWDHRNRLVKASRSGLTITYEYDAFNRLVFMDNSQAFTSNVHFVYDEGINPIMEYSSSHNGPRKYYLWSDAVDLIFGYTGKLFDEATGLQSNLNRWFNPRLGKFISQDPIGFAGADENLYRYVENESVAATDPMGLRDGREARSTLRSVFGVGTSSNTNPANASRARNFAAASGLYSTDRHRLAFTGALNVQDTFAESIPGVGQVYSGGKAITAYNPITGQPLSWFEVSLAVLGVVSGGLGDEVGDAAARNVRTFRSNPTITAPVGAPVSGGWLNDAMKGFKDGELIPDAVLKRLSGRLNRNNTSIIKNEWSQEILERTGDGAQFVRFKDGSAGILLRPNATRYQFVHELKHYEHWLANPAKYAKLGILEREEFVFKALQESNHWRLFTDAERTHALEYIEYIRRLYGN